MGVLGILYVVLDR